MAKVKEVKVAYGLTVPGKVDYEVHRISMEVLLTPDPKEKTDEIFEEFFEEIQNLVIDKALKIIEANDD